MDLKHEFNGATSMSTHATGTFEGKTWDEKPFGQIDGALKLTHVSAMNAYQRDVEGEGTMENVVFYRDAARGSYIGLERVVGRVGGRSGSFVLQHTGTFEGGTVNGTWLVVSGSGTGDLRGEGGFV